MRSLQFCIQAVRGLCALQFSCTEEGWGLFGNSMWTVLARCFVLVIVVHALFLVLVPGLFVYFLLLLFWLLSRYLVMSLLKHLLCVCVAVNTF